MIAAANGINRKQCLAGRTGLLFGRFDHHEAAGTGLEPFGLEVIRSDKGPFLSVGGQGLRGELFGRNEEPLGGDQGALGGFELAFGAVWRRFLVFYRIVSEGLRGLG